MIYHLSLAAVAIALGLLYLLLHLPGALAPARFIPLAKKFPRNYPVGAALMAVAGIWLTVVTATMDLGEVSNLRNILLTLWVSGTILMILFVPSFLAVRALGSLLLLGTCVLLDAAFLRNDAIRFVVTITAYVWAVLGICLVSQPWRLRDWLELALVSESRCRLLCWPGVAYGVVLLGLGLFVY
jgi:hypothetical protein